MKESRSGRGMSRTGAAPPAYPVRRRHADSQTVLLGPIWPRCGVWPSPGLAGLLRLAYRASPAAFEQALVSANSADPVLAATMADPRSDRARSGGL